MFNDGVITHSILDSKSIRIEKGCIMDHCIVSVPLICEEKTIVSYCHLDIDSAPLKDDSVVVIPSGWLFHTVAVMEDNTIFYVTIAFKVEDDLKDSLENSSTWRDCFSSVFFSSNKDTLWKAKFFEPKETMGQSFKATFDSVICGLENSENVQKTKNENNKLHYYSMEDIISLKHMPTILQYKKKITSIQSNYW